MGQNIGRAVNTTLTIEERAKQEQLDVLTLRNAQLKNDYIEVQIQNSKNQLIKNGNAPAMPKPDGTKDNPYPYTDTYTDKDGKVFQLPSQQASQADQANWWSNTKTGTSDFIDDVGLGQIRDGAFNFYKKSQKFYNSANDISRIGRYVGKGILDRIFSHGFK